ncbi:hypothetical protein Gotri_027497 [Gossypium trilobum]|uniref:Uncharacterized protein n=1 Tax=Gossypium trilobum TaxID=34281 RepID=A0A7J9FH66_9ROSI|nr:hypothetical protein [Gossypium trilobum]
MSIIEFRVHDLLLGFHSEALTRNTGKCHGLFSRIQRHFQSYWVEQLHVYQGQFECSNIAYERVPLLIDLGEEEVVRAWPKQSGRRIGKH